MLDIFVGLLQVSYYIVLFTFIPVMILLRLLITIKEKKPLLERLIITFDFTSMAFYLFGTKDTKLYRLYNILMIIYGVFSALALAFGLHMYF